MRAIGFSRLSILLSFLIEAVLLALVGGAVGCLLALPINGITTGSANFNTFSEVTYNFRITYPLVVAALAWGTWRTFKLFSGSRVTRASTRPPQKRGGG